MQSEFNLLLGEITIYNYIFEFYFALCKLSLCNGVNGMEELNPIEKANRSQGNNWSTVQVSIIVYSI